MPDLVKFPSKKPARSQRRILSATTLKALTPPSSGSVDYFDDMTPGLSLRVAANDVRTWTVFYRDLLGRTCAGMTSVARRRASWPAAVSRGSSSADSQPLRR